MNNEIHFAGCSISLPWLLMFPRWFILGELCSLSLHFRWAVRINIHYLHFSACRNHSWLTRHNWWHRFASLSLLIHPVEVFSGLCLLVSAPWFEPFPVASGASNLFWVSFRSLFFAYITSKSWTFIYFHPNQFYISAFQHVRMIWHFHLVPLLI